MTTSLVPPQPVPSQPVRAARPSRPARDPGAYLRAVAAMPGVRADDLRTALAWTAAHGDTCRVLAAATAVRDAADSLERGDPARAEAALAEARAAL